MRAHARTHYTMYTRTLQQKTFDAGYTGICVPHGQSKFSATSALSHDEVCTRTRARTRTPTLAIMHARPLPLDTWHTVTLHVHVNFVKCQPQGANIT